jgi:hypothetical protein
MTEVQTDLANIQGNVLGGFFKNRQGFALQHLAGISYRRWWRS